MRHIAMIVVLACLAFVACEDDPVTPPSQPPVYRELTTPENVLINLETSYNRRNFSELEKLLDSGFTFFLSTGDAGGGLPESWGRSDETAIHTRLFDPEYSGAAPTCSAIALDLVLDEATWTESPVGDEVRYTTTVFYNFKFDIEPDIYYISNSGSKVRLTVRNAGTDDAPHWQLVEMKDLGTPDLAARLSTGTYSMTWGRVKSLYLDPPTERAFLSRSQNWHVLNNIELAYNKRNIAEYDALLDANLTFFLSAADVGGGLPESWDRTVEYHVNQNLFSLAPTAGPTATSISLNILWETDDASITPQPGPSLLWIALPYSGQNGDETWYTTTLFYQFEINVEPDVTYLSTPGSKAQFTIRNAGTAEAPEWTLVEMRDLGAERATAGRLTAIEASSWGRVKALYR